MSSSFALKDQQQHQLQHSSSSFSVQDILCSSLEDYYNSTASTSLPAAVVDTTSRSVVVKGSELDRSSASSVAEEVQTTGRGTGRTSEDLVGSSGLLGACDRDHHHQYSGQIAAAAAFYAGSNVGFYGGMSSGSASTGGGGGACSPHHHTLHHHSHHHHSHHPAAAAAAAFASQYAGGQAELGHYTGSAGTAAAFGADSMPVRGCVGGPWYAPSPAPDPRLTSKSHELEI